MRYHVEFIKRNNKQIKIKWYRIFSRYEFKVTNLHVLKSLTFGDVFYTQGDNIQVFHYEYLRLMQQYKTYFKVVKS